MAFLTIHLTRIKRLSSPAPLPDVTRGEAVSFFSGMWHGVALGCVTGAGAAVLILKLIGKIQ